MADTEQQWLDQQRDTPNFIEEDPADEDGNILNAPMPASLHGYGSSSSSSSASSSGRGATSKRSTPNMRSAISPGTPAPSVSGISKRYEAEQAGMDIYESLFERGRTARKLKEAARHDAILEDEREHQTPLPKVSRGSKMLMKDRNKDEEFSTRAQRLLEEKRRKQEHEVAMLNAKDDVQLQNMFHPRISSYAQRTLGTADLSVAPRTNPKVKQRMEELRREKIIKEMEGLHATPHVNAQSELLAQRKQEREGLSGISYIESMLERDRLAKLARFEQHQQSLLNDAPGTPYISEYAATLARHDDPEKVGDRLFREAELTRQRRAMAEAAEEERARLNAATPNRTHRTPNRSRSYNSSKRLSVNDSSSTSRDGSANDRSSSPNRYANVPSQYSNPEDHQRRKQAKMRDLLEEEAREATHQPLINPISAAIATRLPESSVSRLTQPRSPKLTRGSSDATATNAAKKVAKVGSEPSSRDVALYERLRVADSRRKMRLEEARQQMEQRRVEDCTFAPVTTTSYYPPLSRGVFRYSADGSIDQSDGSGAGSGASIYDRNLQWQKQKEERKAQQLAAQSANETQGCTFQPKISTGTQALLDGEEPHYYTGARRTSNDLEENDGEEDDDYDEEDEEDEEEEEEEDGADLNRRKGHGTASSGSGSGGPIDSGAYAVNGFDAFVQRNLRKHASKQGKENYNIHGTEWNNSTAPSRSLSAAELRFENSHRPNSSTSSKHGSQLRRRSSALSSSSSGRSISTGSSTNSALVN